jgi:hypothetical protein
LTVVAVLVALSALIGIAPALLESMIATTTSMP